jgi:hypothetical protein
MALLDDILGIGVRRGLLIGAGALVLVPFIAPALRWTVKGAVKAGVRTYQGVADASTGLTAGFSGLVSEVRKEMASER